MPALSPSLSAVFLIGFIGVLCALMFLLCFGELLIAMVADWRDRREMRRPFAPNVRFPKPVIFDEGREPHA